MKNIILCVTGSIAAYKSLSLLRLLVKSGKEVRVIMTPSAAAFISPLSFATLSKHAVATEIISNENWNNHVELGLWADAMIIAPTTATTLAKLANGLSDNMVVATYLSAKCPIYIAPAMDLDMWKHPATKSNISKLISFGNHIIPVGNGELASGLIGDGRMAEPEDIVSFLAKASVKNDDLKGKKVLITAGPTRESIDPVRFISNPSTGRMGIALADECYSRGADVHLVLGPTTQRPINSEITIVHVSSAHDMFEACSKHFKSTDIAIFAAAVADYTPQNTSDSKIKKKEGDLDIVLKRTKDIAGSFGQMKKNHQVSVGFALETNDEEKNAEKKLDKKNFNFIVLNSLKEKGAGFQHDTNKVTIFQRGGLRKSYALKSKRQVAVDIVDALCK